MQKLTILALYFVNKRGLSATYCCPNSHTASGWEVTAALQSLNSRRINSRISEDDCRDSRNMAWMEKSTKV